MSKYSVIVPLLLLMAGCGTEITLQPESAPSVWDNPISELVVKFIVGLLMFGYALGLIWLAVIFHLFLMNRYKRFFFRDELKAAIDKLKGRVALTTQEIMRFAAIALSAAVYQGLVFVAVLFLIAEMQTPFG